MSRTGFPSLCAFVRGEFAELWSYSEEEEETPAEGEEEAKKGGDDDKKDE